MKKTAVLLSALLVLLFFGCKATTDAFQTKLKLSESSLVYTEIGGSQLVAVSGDAEWNASSNQSWCSVSPNSGNGSGAINITVDLNNSVELRSAKVTVSSADNSLSCVIVITQAAGHPAGPVTDLHGNSIDANPAVLDFLTAGGNKNIQITSNVAWQIASDQVWCGVSVSSGSGNATVQVTVIANEGAQSRIAKLSISNSEFALTKMVTVTQLGVEPSIVLLPPLIRNIGGTAETISVSVSANVEFDIQPNVSWISVTQASSSAVTLQTQANSSSAARTGTVTFKQKNGTASATLTVNQEGKQPATFYASYSGNDYNDGRSWDKAVKNISTAIYLAAAGDQVWVEEGTYQETVVMKDGVNLYGGFNRTENNIADRGIRRSTILNGAFSMTNDFNEATIVDGFVFNSMQGILPNVIMNNCEFKNCVDVNGGTVSCSTISSSSTDISILYVG